MDALKPLKGERSLMVLTGNQVLDANRSNLEFRVPIKSIDYGKVEQGRMNRTQKDMYGSIQVADMLTREAKAQYEGNCPRYAVPDTRAHTYKIHGQVDMSLNKKAKTTFLQEIENRQKNPKTRVPGPSDYKTEEALDKITLRSTKRFQWDQKKKVSIIDDHIKKEGPARGPAYYSPDRK